MSLMRSVFVVYLIGTTVIPKRRIISVELRVAAAASRSRRRVGSPSELWNEIGMDGLHFDDVIIGCGSAGCVFANQLSADGRRRVLLVEAGLDTPPDAMPPEILDSYRMPLFFGDKYIWPGDMRHLFLGRASSAKHRRASKRLDAWEDVLPYFRRLETDLDFDGPLHSRGRRISLRLAYGRSES